MDGLYHWDMATFRAINLGFRSPLLDLFFLIVSQSGQGVVEALLVLGLYRWPRFRRFISPCVATIAFSGILIADVIKLLVKRDRPSYLSFAIAQEDVHHTSFVSGHSATAFALAMMLVFMTLGTKRWWVGPVALAWAVGVGVSRVYRGVHWPSDVVAGACAGAFGSAVVYLVFDSKGWLGLTLENLPLGRKRSAS